MGRSSFRGRAALLALGAALAVAIGVAWAVWRWPGSVRIEPPADAAARRASDPRPQPAPPVRADASSAAAGAGADSGRVAPRAAAAPATAVPPGVTAAEWSRLEAELAGRPSELARLRAHFEFADAVRRLRDGVPGSAGRREAARAVDAALPARLAARELSAGEARLLKLALLDVLEPEPAARAAALARWERDAATRAAAAGDAEVRAAAVRDAEFLRRQQALVAAWQAQPAALRDARALERELEQLRRRVYGAPTPVR